MASRTDLLAVKSIKEVAAEFVALEQPILHRVEIRLLAPDDTLERERFRKLIEQHHSPKSDTLVGEQLRDVAEVDGRWIPLLSWSAAANHLKDREQWLDCAANNGKRSIERVVSGGSN